MVIVKIINLLAVNKFIL